MCKVFVTLCVSSLGLDSLKFKSYRGNQWRKSLSLFLMTKRTDGIQDSLAPRPPHCAPPMLCADPMEPRAWPEAAAQEAPQLCPLGDCSEVVSGSLGALTYLHLVLDPGPDGVGLGGKLAPQALVGMLAGQLLLQRLVPDGHELLHLSGPKGGQGQRPASAQCQ